MHTKTLVVTTLIAAVAVMTPMITKAVYAALPIRGEIAALENAHSATVPPAVVAANRAELAAIVSSNILGQNTPAIAATEAQYVEMWAQDAAAMYRYAGASAAATQLTPFQSEQARHP